MITQSLVTSRPEDAALLDHADKEGEEATLPDWHGPGGRVHDQLLLRE